MSNGSELTPSANYSVSIQQFEEELLSFIERYGLPTAQVLVDMTERLKVFKNFEVVEKIEYEQRQRSIYVSKFIAATAAGLFDAALNYLWDETIYELRRRVAQYDLPYFFEAAVGISSSERKELATEEDLVKIDDNSLIQGAHKIELISDLGYKHLDYVRYMRNWASAAHPNQNEITGLKLISMFETCVIEVITLPLSNVVVEIKKLLKNVKNNKISQTEAKDITTFFCNLPTERANALAEGFFGIYTQLNTTSQTRENVRLLIPDLWERVDEQTRQKFGIKHAKFSANNDQEQQKLGREFLETVDGLSYISNDLLAFEIQTAIENLMSAHNNFNNFHNEPPFARELLKLVGKQNKVPKQIKETYVVSLVTVFLTNGSGFSWGAEPIYIHLLKQLDTDEALIAILSFTNDNISNRLQFPLCQEKFRELMEMMKNKVSQGAVKELIDDIENYKGPLDKMKKDSEIKRKVKIVKKIIEI